MKTCVSLERELNYGGPGASPNRSIFREGAEAPKSAPMGGSFACFFDDGKRSCAVSVLSGACPYAFSEGGVGGTGSWWDLVGPVLALKTLNLRSAGNASCSSIWGSFEYLF